MNNDRHHYVPQLYLDGFTDDAGLIHVTDRKLRKRWTAKPSKVAWAPEYHRVDLDGFDPMGIEKAFGDVPLDRRTLLASRLKEMPDSYDMDDEDACMMNMIQAEHSTQVYSAEQGWACLCGGSQADLDALIYPGQSDLGAFPPEPAGR